MPSGAGSGKAEPSRRRRSAEVRAPAGRQTFQTTHSCRAGSLAIIDVAEQARRLPRRHFFCYTVPEGRPRRSDRSRGLFRDRCLQDGHVLAQLARPLHLRTADDHALALHPTGRGRVTIARRFGAGSWHEASVPVSDLPYVTHQLQGEHDVYLTQNRFFSWRRLVAHLAELDALFTDLDYY